MTYYADAPFYKKHLRKRWHHWLTEQALPLWITRGFNERISLFHERLSFDHSAIPLPELRLMVQARQIATYCHAEHHGLYHGGQKALACLDNVTHRYYRPDGKPGWAFAVSPDGSTINPLRDLYAHAFILYAHAKAYQLTKDPALIKRAKETIADIKSIFTTENGGFLDTAPSQPLRRQNPHMHLLEAFLALFFATDDLFFLNEAEELVTFSLKTFYRSDSGMLLEFFTPDWVPTHAENLNHVEPGHLFEWSWLLMAYRRAKTSRSLSLPLSTNLRYDQIFEAAKNLYAAGLRYGVSDDAFVYDSILSSGLPQERSLRLWPQTEFLRKLVGMYDVQLLLSVSKNFFTFFAPPSLKGGWIDRLHEDRTPASSDIPASSLYHIYSTAIEIISD
ncbi:mannose-6-phosphate isomerase [Saccharibacter sp. 17.LH.SD]|uniref:AGE family epimerase/isomerase n=1 Tax=Saccharibacter sp. 17.LH.SD TaxID=2689393 RepID=UPI0013713038|nr:AGE family epimerase/isomerase [Saccharibacter sp. 17.LH.SD]MXV43524.1 mannose-6-phosphate isomerase [Saccharibacter sp. 17.LH.SD]